LKESPKSPYRRAGILLDCILLFLLSAAIVKPLFQSKHLNLWGSIESTFIADARFLKEHGPHPRWQPLWYCGTRFDYIYPPALRYGTALLSNIWIPAKAYHINIAFFFCAGIAGVYLLIRLMSDSRGAAWLGAAGVALLSPSFLFIKEVRDDALFLIPLRLGALVRYGEGPHMSALAVLPFALVASFFALRRRQPAALAIAAVLYALVVSTNFYGATALAIFFPILVWTVWVTYDDRRVWLRAAAIAVLAYGLTAFWLVPSYVRVTIDNLRLVAKPGNSWSIWVACAVAVGFAAVSLRVCRARPDRAYTTFVAGSLLFMSLNVLGYYALGFRVAGEPGRLIPELDLVIILGVIELLRRARSIKARVLVAVIAAVAFLPATKFLPRAWRFYQPEANYQKRVEYRITDWMARNLPDARAMVTGSVRFWYDAWHDLAQLGGGSEQGLMNASVPTAMWQIQAAPNAEISTHWMIALGVDAVVVQGPRGNHIYSLTGAEQPYRVFVERMQEGSPGYRMRLPLKVHPISAGLKGGLLGGRRG
jgi:hypothetical protein